MVSFEYHEVHWFDRNVVHGSLKPKEPKLADRKREMQIVLLETGSNQAYIFRSNRLRECIGASELITGLTQAIDDERDQPSVIDQVIQNVLAQHRVSRSTVQVILRTSGKVLLRIELLDIDASSAPDSTSVVRDQERLIATDIVDGVTRQALAKSPGLDVCGVVVAAEANADSSDDALRTGIRTAYRLLPEIRQQRIPVLARRPVLPVTAVCANSGGAAARRQNVGGDERDVSEISHMARRSADQWNRRISNELRDLKTRSGKTIRLPANLERLETEIETLDWLGVIHIDGINFGQVFHRLESEWGQIRTTLPRSGGDAHVAYARTLDEFSRALDESARHAFRSAVQHVAELTESPDAKADKAVPIVPLILAGDDMTLLCPGQFAIPFAIRYLKVFEERTRVDSESTAPIVATILKALQLNRLSASAGVAIVKPHFPFTSAYELAKQLSASAKTVTVKILRQDTADDGSAHSPCSAIDFHVLYDSVWTNLADIRNRLTVHANSEEKHCQLTARPYLVTKPEQSQLQSDSNSWVEAHCWDDLVRRVRLLQCRDEDGRISLPATQIYRLRESLFAGKRIADAALHAIEDRYLGDSGERLIRALTENESPSSLFRPYVAGPSDKSAPEYETRFLDALELTPFWPLTAADQSEEVLS